MRGWIGFDMALRVFDFGWTGVWRCKASNVLPSPRHDAGSAQSGQDRSVRGLTSIRSNFSHSWYRAKLVLGYIFFFFRMYTLHYTPNASTQVKIVPITVSLGRCCVWSWRYWGCRRTNANRSEGLQMMKLCREYT